MYKVSSLANMHYGLARYLKETKDFDIINELQFSSYLEGSKLTEREMKSQGKGDIGHHPCIPMDGKSYLPQSNMNYVHFYVKTKVEISNNI